MNKTISVVIPAYNVEQYIEKCLDSVLCQTYRDLEVIVVDDGSTDNTAQLIKKYTSDKRVKYINQENAGVSAARNNGMNAASGEYLAFVDSDDYLENTMYEKLYAALLKTDVDVAVCNYSLVYESHTDYEYANTENDEVDISMPEYFYKYCACDKPNNYIWTRLYKTGTVRKSGIRFENHKLGDDTLFNFKLLPFLKRISYVSGGYYNYFQRPGSNVYTVAAKNNLARVYADSFQSLINHYKMNGFTNYLEAMPVHAYTRLRSIFFYSRLANVGDGEIIRNIRDGFHEREIVDCLNRTATVDKYVEANDLSAEEATKIKRIMTTAVNKPELLYGVAFP